MKVFNRNETILLLKQISISKAPLKNCIKIWFRCVKALRSADKYKTTNK